MTGTMRSIAGRAYISNDYNRSEGRFVLLMTSPILFLAAVTWALGSPLATLAEILFFTYLNGVGILIELFYKPKGVTIMDGGYLFVFRLRSDRYIPIERVIDIKPQRGSRFLGQISAGRLQYRGLPDSNAILLDSKKEPGENPTKAIVMSFDLATSLKEDWQRRKEMVSAQ